MCAVDIVFAFLARVCCDDFMIKDSRKISKAFAVNNKTVKVHIASKLYNLIDNLLTVTLSASL